jgi:hypothetical protein
VSQSAERLWEFVVKYVVDGGYGLSILSMLRGAMLYQDLMEVWVIF